MSEKEERRQKKLGRLGRLGADFSLRYSEAKHYLEALESLKMSAVRDNQGVLDLIARLDNHVRGALRGVG